MSDDRSRVRVVTPPEYEPVTLAEAKVWCRIDDDDTEQDATVLMLIIAMREHAELLTGRAYVQRTLELTLDAFPDSDKPIELPYPPVQSVSFINYIDVSGGLQTLAGSPSAFQEDLYSAPGRVAPLRGTSWPGTASDVLNAVRVRYVAGYAKHADIPRQLRLWIQSKISTLYDNRDQFFVGGQLQNLPRDFTVGLLDGLRASRMFA